jgi:hypothetical protein
VHTALAYELYTAAFELLRQPSPCENRLREACACASIHGSLQSAVEQAAFDVVHRLPKRSRRHFLAVAQGGLTA